MHFAAKTADIPASGKMLATIDGTEVLLVQTAGDIYACENECPHQGAPLAGGQVRNDGIYCLRHGYRFDLQTGMCSDFPEYTLKLFRVDVKDGDIYVALD